MVVRTTGGSMRFFRRRSSLGFLALLAVAMQAVLAFADTHAHSHTQAVAGKLAMRAITFGACAPRAQHPCAPVRSSRRPRQLSCLRCGQPRDGCDPQPAARRPDTARALPGAGAGPRHPRCRGR